MKIAMIAWLVFACMISVSAAEPIRPKPAVPDKVVVLTFDDSVKSHYTKVRPILKKYRFGATFFITEGFDFKTNKTDYMTWEEIAQLHRDGFEIGNHTRDHVSLNTENREKLSQQLDDLNSQVAAINRRCREHGIPKTVSFAYPGNRFDLKALPLLQELGIKFARRGASPELDGKDGRGFAYEPALDHPLLIPSAGIGRPEWEWKDFEQAVSQAELGRIAVLQFHGVPDDAHPWVNTPLERFEQYMSYLAAEDFTVIAMRDLETYVDPEVAPRNPEFVILDRQKKESRDDFRRPEDPKEFERWLENMVVYHRFSVPEIRSATGLTEREVIKRLDGMSFKTAERQPRFDNDRLVVLPYPGGRHPRTGFLDGALRPQRETKISVFTPWDHRQYVVVDIPEAIRRNDEPEHGLLYLAHTHVDTMWDKLGIPLEQLEWEPGRDGMLEFERTLPNGVVFGTRVEPGHRTVQMSMWLENGSDENLSNLRVQNCMMLKGAPEFSDTDPGYTVETGPYIARRSHRENRWIIMAWSPNFRTWYNDTCPCIHSDPQFEDCAPGERSELKGWLSFYEGSDVQAELARIEATGWSTSSADK